MSNFRSFLRENRKFRFEDQDDHEEEIFLILRSARACTSVSLAEKRDSCRHSTIGYSENVVVAETSYQVLEPLSLCDRERVLPSSIKLTVLTFLIKKKNR